MFRKTKLFLGNFVTCCVKKTLPRYKEFFWIFKGVLSWPQPRNGSAWLSFTENKPKDSKRLPRLQNCSIIDKQTCSYIVSHSTAASHLLIETYWKQTLPDPFCFHLIFQLTHGPLLSARFQGWLAAAGNLLFLRAASQLPPHSRLPACFPFSLTGPTALPAGHTQFPSEKRYFLSPIRNVCLTKRDWNKVKRWLQLPYCIVLNNM